MVIIFRSLPLRVRHRIRYRMAGSVAHVVLRTNLHPEYVQVVERINNKIRGEKICFVENVDIN